MSMINRKCNYTTSDSVPWREEFPEYKDEDLPGVCLRGSRHKEGLTQKQLSEDSQKWGEIYPANKKGLT